MKHYDVIIVGGGNTGRHALDTLRSQASALSLLLIDEEGPLPYKRTQISKNLAKDYNPDELSLHSAQWYKEKDVHLAIGMQAYGLDPLKKTIRLGPHPDAPRQGLKMAEEEQHYDALLLATGSQPYIPPRMPISPYWSVLRTLADGIKLRATLQQCRQVVIMGMGVLGVELAYQCSLMKLKTTLLGRGKWPMSSWLDQDCAASLTASILEAGIKIHPETEWESLRLENRDKGLSIKTTTQTLEADHLLLAMGTLPQYTLAQEAHLAIGKGIKVDPFLRTSLPGIWAAGDCAEHPNRLVTGLWHAAENQGRLAAFSILGKKIINENPPYRLKCQVFGGLWFSAGPVGKITEEERIKTTKNWEKEGILWRPRFVKNRLVALSAAASQGMDKKLAQRAQESVIKGDSEEQLRQILLE